MTAVHIRWMIRHDMPEVLAVVAASGYPVSEEGLLVQLRRRDTIGMVAELKDLGPDPRGYTPILGFMLYRLGRPRIELLHFAVRPEFRRRGVGRAMVFKLLTKLRTPPRDRLTVLVRETDDRAIAFWRSMGLAATGVERNAYADTWEDGYAFELTVVPAPDAVSAGRPGKGGGV